MANNNFRSTYYTDAPIPPYDYPSHSNEESSLAHIAERVKGKRQMLLDDYRELHTSKLRPATAYGAYLPPDGEGRGNESSRRRQENSTLSYWPESLLNITRSITSWFGLKGNGEANTSATVIEGPRTRFDQSKVDALRLDAGVFSQSTLNFAQQRRRRRT